MREPQLYTCRWKLPQLHSYTLSDVSAHAFACWRSAFGRLYWNHRLQQSAWDADEYGWMLPIVEPYLNSHPINICKAAFAPLGMISILIFTRLMIAGTSHISCGMWASRMELLKKWWTWDPIVTTILCAMGQTMSCVSTMFLPTESVIACIIHKAKQYRIHFLLTVAWAGIRWFKTDTSLSSMSRRALFKESVYQIKSKRVLLLR